MFLNDRLEFLPAAALEGRIVDFDPGKDIWEKIFLNHQIPERGETAGTENLSLWCVHAPSHIQLDVKLTQSRVQFKKVCGKTELCLFQAGRKDGLTADRYPLSVNQLPCQKSIDVKDKRKN